MLTRTVHEKKGQGSMHASLITSPNAPDSQSRKFCSRTLSRLKFLSHLLYFLPGNSYVFILENLKDMFLSLLRRIWFYSINLYALSFFFKTYFLFLFIHVCVCTPTGMHNHTCTCSMICKCHVSQKRAPVSGVIDSCDITGPFEE